MRKNGGFTLLEMIIALSLSSIVLIMIYSAERTIIRSVASGKMESERIQSLAMKLRLIQSDLNSVFIYKEPAVYPVKSETEIGGKKYFLSFFMLRSASSFPVTDGINSDYSSELINTSYGIEETDGKKALVRAEREFTDSENLIKEKSLIFDDVSEVKAEFYSNHSWNDKWDSSDNYKNPEALRLSITCKIKGREEKFMITGLPVMSGK